MKEYSTVCRAEERVALSAATSGRLMTIETGDRLINVDIGWKHFFSY
jgi:hypothetical protein